MTHHTGEYSGFQDGGLLLQACMTGDGSESGRHGSYLSAATIKSFRESGSFRRYTISSAASSPGYFPRGKPASRKMDPSTYSFSVALKENVALQQERFGSAGEELSAAQMNFFGGKILNSKWDEAERYISNPFSGEVPMQCLSSFLSSKITQAERARPVPVYTTTFMSAPLSFPVQCHQEDAHPAMSVRPLIEEAHSKGNDRQKVEELKGRNGSWMRDVGTQINPLDWSSSSPSIVQAGGPEEGSESFRLTGGRCCIFQRTRKSKDVVEEIQATSPKIWGTTDEAGKVRKTANSLVSLIRWKTWWSRSKQGRAYCTKKIRSRIFKFDDRSADRDSTAKPSTIITIQAAPE